ncbi:MAG: NfeD family protein [Clostridia bacterium]|nr:NfeD family protein [Clostridia bacterium]
MAYLFANIAANIPMTLCLLFGALLLVAEVFLPGFGLPGIAGIVFVAVGVVLAWLTFGPLVAVAVLLVLIAVLAVLVTWVVNAASEGKGRYCRIFLKEKDELHINQDMEVLVGRTGIATSVLRPAGIADFDGVRLNVVTEGGFADQGAHVQVVRVEGARIVVRPVKVQ